MDIKKIYAVCLLLSMGMIFLSCDKDIKGSVSDSIVEGEIKTFTVGISMDVPEEIKVAYAAVDEDEIDMNTLRAFIFSRIGNDALLLNDPIEVVYKGNNIIELELPLRMDSVDIFIVGNLSAEQLSIVQNLKKNEKTKEEIGELLYGTADQNGLISAPFLMCSALKRTDIKPNTNLGDFKMQRIVSKIDVDASSIPTADFELESIILSNVSAKGSLFPLDLVSNRGGTLKYEEVSVSSNQLYSHYYCYENSGRNQDGSPNTTKMLLKAKYKNNPSSYYRLDIVYGNPKSYDIKRNVKYIVSIRNVRNIGYRTADEAMANGASNDIDYDVSVVDPNIGVVVGTGEYFLSSSNTEYIFYHEEAIVDAEIAVIITNAPNTVTSGYITTTSPGITLKQSIILGNQDNGKRDNVYTLLKADIDKNFTAGSIYFRIGNLEQNISLERRTPITAEHQVVDFNKRYLSAELTDNSQSGGLVDFMLFSSNNTLQAVNLCSIFFNSEGNIYAHFKENTTGIDRITEAMFSKRGEAGKTKITFVQKSK